MGQMLHDFLTEKDGISFCPLRMLLIASVLFYIGMELRDAVLVSGYAFSGHCKDFADGLANILGLGGAAVAGKSFTEPQS